MGRHAVATTGSDLSEFQVARLVVRHCVNYTKIELELTFFNTKGIGIDSGIDKKELEWNLELIKRN